MNTIMDLKKTQMNWEHSKERQGPWQRKTMINLWFIHGTEMGMMLDTVRHVRTVLEQRKIEVHGEKVRANLELRLRGKSMGKAQAMVFNAFGAANGDKNQKWSSWRTVQVSSTQRSVLTVEGSSQEST